MSSLRFGAPSPPVTSVAAPRVPTHREIAEAAGVSKATVSLALRHAKKISEEVRERVWREARRLGYRHDAQTVAYMSYMRRRRPAREMPVIGLLTGFASEREWTRNRYFRRFYDTVVNRATFHGYRIEEIWAQQPGMTRQRLDQILRTRGIEGLIIAPSGSPDMNLPLHLDQFAWAECTDHGWQPKLHRAAPHHFQNLRLALAELTNLGYRRIGLACVGEDMLLKGREFEGALALHQSEIGAPQPKAYINRTYEMEGFGEWLLREKPDAVVSNYENCGEYISAAGLAVPADVGFAVIGLLPDLAGLAGVDGRFAAIDAAVVDIVVSQISRGERGVPADPKLVLFEGVWVPGQSAPGPSATAAVSRPKPGRSSQRTTKKGVSDLAKS